MTQRLQFITDHQRGLYSMAELCARNSISRKTGYKWLSRYATEGPPGLVERSHAPHVCPHRIADEVVTLLLGVRDTHPTWGPKKLVHYLARRHRQVRVWPAISTVADLLKRRGLVPSRRRRRRRPEHPGTVPISTTAPNDLWTADFKGQFLTRNGLYCYPLTIADQETRYLLAVHGLLNTRVKSALPVFERAFREYGLPLAIRTDNGVPFASTGLRGLTRLNVWWLRLGIQHQRIRPASPQENGAHERMHRTLKNETTRPPQADLMRQQRRFNAFRREYNEERPHEALAGDPPGAHYESSPRPYPRTLPPLEYPGHFLIKHVTSVGTIRFKYTLVVLGRALDGQHIGLEETDDGIWSVYLGQVLIGKLDEATMQVYG
ncbi:MAG: transposase [Gemmatimonadaceae bacterium]|nr:transposase [Gemmatimonadaceae bacterium]